MKKKWPILIIILVVVAVVLTIVFINLFREKDTKALAKNVNSVTQTGYLNEDNKANLDIDAYLKNMLELQEDEKETIAGYANAYVAFEVAGQFFNKQIVFTDYTNAYKTNRKKIQDNFQKAQSVADKLEKYLTENGDKIGDNMQWNIRTWTDCKDYVEDLFKYSSNAFEGLTEVYKASIPSKIMNNDLSSLVFDEFNKMTKSIKEAGTGEKLVTLVNAYLSEDGVQMILDFPYNSQRQAKVKDINENANSVWYADFVAGNI